MMIERVSAPETNRIAVKLAGSISPVRNAIRQRIELNANAISANAVRATILITYICDIRRCVGAALNAADTVIGYFISVIIK